MLQSLAQALEHYAARTGAPLLRPRAALFDMDGILFNSMPGHARAWKRMCDENNIPATLDEFFLYEGRTGASTINILFRRTFAREATPDEIERLYRRKTELFRAQPPVDTIPGAKETLHTCLRAGLLTVLVTGSGQSSLISRLEDEFPGAFPPGRRITARDVTHGKPHPEPFIKGRLKAGAEIPPCRTIAVDNAPLGVRSAAASGAFTIGVNTGDLPEGTLRAEGADIEVPSMFLCRDIILSLLTL